MIQILKILLEFQFLPFPSQKRLLLMCWIIFHLFSRTHNFWTNFGILVMVYPYSSSLLSYASMAEIDDVVSKWKLAYFFPKVHFIFIHHNFDRTLDSFGAPLFQSFPSPKYVSAGSTYKLVLLSCLNVCTGSL